MRPAGRQKRRARTLAGELRYKRTVYECSACRGSHAPRDAELNLRLGERMTRRVVRKAAFVGAVKSFASGSKMLEELAELEISPAEVGRVAHEEGRALRERQEARDAAYLQPVSPDRPAPKPEIQARRLVLEADATCVLTVKGEEHKSVYCAMGFDLDARGRDAGGRPFVAEKRYAACAEDMEPFGRRVKALGYRMGMRRAEAIAFLADGARPLWRWAEENLPPGTVFIQDFWHVCEHLAGLLKELYGQVDAERLERWKRWLRASQHERVLDDLETERKPRRGAKRQAIDKELAYLRAAAPRMDYARYEAQGWPIGSGAIEGACKYFVKQRFAVTGAHWRRSNIGNALALREAIFNKEWDSYWKDRQLAA
jgi:hypothetical protein